MLKHKECGRLKKDTGIGLFFICAIVTVSVAQLYSTHHNLMPWGSYNAYHDGVRGILSGTDPYPPREWIEDSERPLDARFVYSPTFALFFYPFSALYGAVGVLLWIATNAAVFWYGLTALLSKLSSEAEVQGRWLLLTAIMMFNETLKCALCLQVNGVIAGMTLTGAALYFSGRYRWAALLLALGTSFKIFPVVLTLLLMLEFNLTFIGYYFLFLALAFAAPIALLGWSFNAELLAHWWLFISHDTVKPGFLGLQSSLLYFGMPMNNVPFMAFALLNAMIIAVVALVAFRRNDHAAFLHIAVPLALCFMLLFNKRTESPTLVVVSPVLALMLQAWLSAKKRGDTEIARAHLATIIFSWWLFSLAFSDLTPKPIRQIAHDYRFMSFGLAVMYLWGWARAIAFFLPRRDAVVAQLKRE